MRIISGGQTGVDRAGLDAAIELGIPHGGWCPKGRRSLDGRIPPKYQLKETLSSDYRMRTLKNIMEADATVVIRGPKWSPGTKLTVKQCVQYRKQYFLVEDRFLEDENVVSSFVGWLKLHGVRTLNVAGPSENKFPGIGNRAKCFLVKSLKLLEDSGGNPHSQTYNSEGD